MSFLPSRRVALLAGLLALALTYLPRAALAQDQIYVHDISGPVRVFPLGTNGDVSPSKTFSPAAPNQGGGMALDLVHKELIVANLLGNRLVIFPLTGSGSRTIEGLSTQINSPFGVAYDPMRDEIVVANQNSNSLTFYPRGASGDVAPLRTLTGLTRPQHVVIDPVHDQIFVKSGSAVLIFGRSAGGGVVGPVNSISAGLDNPQGIGYDAAHDEIYVANFGSGTGFVAVYARGSGVLQRTIGGNLTELSFATTVTVNPATGEIYVASFFPASVKVFAPVSGSGNVNVAPIRRIEGTNTGTFEPWFLAIDPPPGSPS